MSTIPAVLDLLEQASGIYWATITDDAGAVLPANALNTLALTLYVKKADGTIAYVNSRNAQNVLNANNVAAYAALQTRADGFTYNLRWEIQGNVGGDSALIEALPFERHIALFEWSWPRPSGGTGLGKHEVVLNVQALDEV